MRGISNLKSVNCALRTRPPYAVDQIAAVIEIVAQLNLNSRGPCSSSLIYAYRSGITSPSIGEHACRTGRSSSIGPPQLREDWDIGMSMRGRGRHPASLQLTASVSHSDARSDNAVCAGGEEHLCSLAQWALLSLDGVRG